MIAISVVYRNATFELSRAKPRSHRFEKDCTKCGVMHSLFVNRDSRADRRVHIESILSLANIHSVRVPAVEVFDDKAVLALCWDGGSRKCAGQVGCQRSHVKALNHAILHRWEHVAIFEDDFEWREYTDVDRVQRAVSQVMAQMPDWDVIAISLNVQNSTVVARDAVRIGPDTISSIVKIHEALATHGYLVHMRVYEKLREAFFKCNVTGDLFTAIDTCWQPLQRDLNWYGLQPQLGTQGRSYSDIESRVVSYVTEFNM